MKNDGGPAFPIPDDGTWADPQTCKVFVPYRGMSLRDWFAGQALASLASQRDFNNFANVRDGHAVSGIHDELATACYRLADAMLKERSRE